jgi:hypothetical protein
MGVTRMGTGFHERITGEPGNYDNFGLSRFTAWQIDPGPVLAVAIYFKRKVDFSMVPIRAANDKSAIDLLNLPALKLFVQEFVSPGISGKEKYTAGLFIQAVHDPDLSLAFLEKIYCAG